MGYQRQFYMNGPGYGYGIGHFIMLATMFMIFAALIFFVFRHFDHAYSGGRAHYNPHSHDPWGRRASTLRSTCARCVSPKARSTRRSTPVDASTSRANNNSRAQEVRFATSRPIALRIPRRSPDNDGS